MKKYPTSEEQFNRLSELVNSGISISKAAKQLKIPQTQAFEYAKKVNLKSRYSKLSVWEKEWLIENLPSHSKEFCAEFLGKTPDNIKNLGVKFKIKRKPWLYRNYNVNPNRFFDIKEPEIAYFLGLIWGDGTVRSGDRKICLMMNKDDVDSLNLFEHIGKMTYQVIDHRETHPTWKICAKLSFKNRPLFDYLISLDYREKSYVSPCKILDKIPENLKHYFILGWADADGHWVKLSRGFIMAGSKSQDWKALEDFCKKNKLSYTIKLQRNKRGEGSVFRISKGDFLKFGKILYKDFKIGLLRKKISFEESLVKFQLLGLIE